MNLNWQLSSVYKGFDDELFLNEHKAIESQLALMDTLSTQLTNKASLESFFKTMETLYGVLYKQFTYCNLVFSTDTSNTESLTYQNKLSKLYSQLSAPLARLKAFLKGNPDVQTFIAESEILTEYAFIILELQESANHTLSEEEEILAANMAITGSNAFSLLQSKLTSTLSATLVLDGEEKTLTISELRNLAYSPDAIVRKTAYEAELKAYEKIDEAVAMSLNAIKGEVITLSELRGYDSPLQMTLKETRMTEKTLESMLSAIEKALPKFHEYLGVKATLLGHQDGLPFYDLFAPMGQVNKTFSYTEGCDFVLEQFGQFSPKLQEVAKDAIEKAWIDVAPKNGKVSGAFCASLHQNKEFRVMLNYTGTLSDVITMAHELGHGYHAICQNDEKILNTESPMPLAETASTFCETIVNHAAIAGASKEEAFSILESSLQDATQVICDIYSRFLFESSVFDNRADKVLSVSSLNKLMIEAQEKAYGTGLDHHLLHPYMWLIKPHYYSAGLNFYNFPYAFGLLFAKGLYAKYLEDKAFFISQYDDLLAAAGKMSIIDVCRIMSIDVEGQDFWDSSLAIISEEIDQFIALSKEV